MLTFQPLGFPTRNAGEPKPSQMARILIWQETGCKKAMGKNTTCLYSCLHLFHHFPQFESLRIDIDWLILPLPEKNGKSPVKKEHPKKKLIFQPSIWLLASGRVDVLICRTKSPHSQNLMSLQTLRASKHENLSCEMVFYVGNSGWIGEATHLEPETNGQFWNGPELQPIFKWLFQLDDSKYFDRKMGCLTKHPSILNWLFSIGSQAWSIHKSWQILMAIWLDLPPHTSTPATIQLFPRIEAQWLFHTSSLDTFFVEFWQFQLLQQSSINVLVLQNSSSSGDCSLYLRLSS